jgi:hypothetical protein
MMSKGSKTPTSEDSMKSNEDTHFAGRQSRQTSAHNDLTTTIVQCYWHVNMSIACH